ncbi:T-cell surface antigen CD2-like isoform X1 [Clupea harengus]|uniref:T-cell surface antigen CD2-like isoform X1 n=1 Tax=Clupea harengus TaxID=7950 RepID=A0A6P8EQQ7_CLUHA|nr:T-cell surface antigen CD2-like isoform X1 [Clupea harengus]
MNFQIAFVVLCLCGLEINASTDPKCQDKKLEGETHTIILKSPKQDKDSLNWKCNDKLIYQRRRMGKPSFSVNVNVNELGNLELTNLNISMSGTYKGEHFGENGKSITKIEKTLCVFAKAPVPKLVWKCPPEGVPVLECEPKSHQGFKLLWIRNNVRTNEDANPLERKKFKSTDRYKCSLSNDQYEGDIQESEEVTLSCGDSEKWFGYNKWLMLAIIAGGGSLLLILIVSLIVICCKNHRRHRRRQRDEEELRLSNLQYIGTGPRPRPKQTARGQPVPPIPDEQGYFQGPEGDPSPADPKPKKQPRPRAPPPPMEDEDELIPPLPQPRRKGP